MNIVVTGSTKGIGYGLAINFLKMGNSVLINGRDENRTGDALNKIKKNYPEEAVISYTCDVSDYSSVVKMYEYAEKEFGSVDIWINNAGMNQNNENIYNHNIEKMNQIVEVNIKGMLNGTRVASERMMSSGGYIYNMEGFGSDGTKMNFMSFYGMTKCALRYFTESAAKEVKNTKVKIGTLSPGMVITDFLMDSLPEDPEKRANVIKIFNILCDRVEDVTEYLTEKIMKNNKNGVKIAWLTKAKIFFRFALQPIVRRKLI